MIFLGSFRLHKREAIPILFLDAQRCFSTLPWGSPEEMLLEAITTSWCMQQSFSSQGSKGPIRDATWTR